MVKNNIYLIIIAIYIIVLVPDVIKLVKLAKKPSLNIALDRYIFRIHVFALVFGFTLSVALIAFEVNIFNYSSPIEYSQVRKITLKDFNGFKLPNQKHQGSNSFAFITSTIELGRDKNRVDIKSYFHPARSYVFIDDLQNDALLRHEMYHFHITELWARKLRKKVANLQSLPPKKILDELYNEILLMEDSMQKAYDYDSDHGYLLGKQIEWQGKVDSALLVLKP